MADDHNPDEPENNDETDVSSDVAKESDSQPKKKKRRNRRKKKSRAKAENADHVESEARHDSDDGDDGDSEDDSDPDDRDSDDNGDSDDGDSDPDDDESSSPDRLASTANNALDLGEPDSDDVITVRDARRLHKSGSKLLKRNRKRLAQRQIEEVELALADLDKALATAKRDKPEPQLLEAYHRADRKLDKHLAFAQKSAIREYAESIFLAVLFALLLRAFVVEAFKIPTKSMVPTLLEGDHLFVNKFAYGIRIPFTTSRLVTFGEPERGDVIVFIFPREEAREHLLSKTHDRDCIDETSLREEKDYIKRVIGLPGDSIQVIGNVVHINGEPLERTVHYRRTVSDGLPPHKRAEIWAEETLEDENYMTISRDRSPAGNFGPVTVLDSHVFVMGDNRDNSSDSRCWGQVPMENIKGEATIIWWSSGLHGARTSRLFSLID